MRLPLPQLVTSSPQPGHIAEVVETSTTEFLAQCLEPDALSFAQMPAFGSWVKAADEDSGNQIYGVVYHATTSPLDSVHRATALGLSLAELREQQPQIFAMLKTEFRVAIVGFCPAGDATIYQHLPPRPPQVHQAVYCCPPDEVVTFTEQLDFLRTLMDMRGAPVDGLIAAVIREVYQLRQLDRDWLVQAGRVLNVQLKDDYDRLRIILAQIHP
ncbi:MAG: HAS-barrel domain-containing protein [Cyanobacteria bacterium P01_F01_bin.56]